MKAENGVREMLTGMRNMMITLIFHNTRCFEGQEKAGQGLRRRTLQAFPPPRSASLRRVFADNIVGQI